MKQSTVGSMPVFDPRQVPFSFFGSYMSLSVPRDSSDLFFRNHHGGAVNLFPIRVLEDGNPVASEREAVPWKLELKTGKGLVEICFESPGTVRMRGRGVGLQLGEKHLIYSEAPERFVMNCPRTRRYQVEVLRGHFELRQLVAAQPIFPKVAVIGPADDGVWELAIDEFWSTWERPERKTFDAAMEAARTDFMRFLAALPEVRAEDQLTRNLAAYVDWSCTVAPCGHIKRPSILMSKCWMSNVWSWDHCFNAMALAKAHPALALDQMLTMVDHQDKFGSYPDSLNDTWMHYNFSKPPVHGWAFSELLKAMPAPPSGDVMRVMYRSLGAQASWWMKHRTRNGGNAECRMLNAEGGRESESGRATGTMPEVFGTRHSTFGLPYYLHGNDSGWDNSTMFGRGTPLIGPDLSALLVVQMDVLAGLAGSLGMQSEAADWKRRADALFGLLMRELWVGDHFVARLASDGSVVESQSLIPWMPILLGERLPVEVRACLKRGIEGHLTEWGLATERVDSPLYKRDGYWQGPIWAPSTLIAVHGLDRAGYPELADEIAERFCRLCRKSGFAENYDAITGDTLCDPAYTWTASVYLLLAARLAAPDRARRPVGTTA